MAGSTSTWATTWAIRLAVDKECVARHGASDYCGPRWPTSPMPTVCTAIGATVPSRTLPSGQGSTRKFPGGALGVAVGDFNGDGWLDIYVANDQVPNKLWMNQGDGTLLNEAMLSGSSVNEEGQPEASMGLVVGDFNGDGKEDLFMSHLSRETNTLYLNDGTGMFIDSTRDSGLGMPSWEHTGFGVSLFDSIWMAGSICSLPTAPCASWKSRPGEGISIPFINPISCFTISARDGSRRSASARARYSSSRK